MTKIASIAIATIATLAVAVAQPASSPAAEASATVNGKNINVKYSAPSMRGRKIFGGLQPWGSRWRAGANAATVLTTDTDLDLAGLKVPKGSYSLYVLLGGENDWTLIVNKQTGQSGMDYDEAQDLGRVKMNITHPAAPIEKFKISIDTKANKGTLTLAWENTVASVPFTAK